MPMKNCTTYEICTNAYYGPIYLCVFLKQDLVRLVSSIILINKINKLAAFQWIISYHKKLCNYLLKGTFPCKCNVSAMLLTKFDYIEIVYTSQVLLKT